MQILGCTCLMVVICSVLELHKGILQAFFGLFLMDCVSCLKVLTQNGGFKGGFFVIRYFSPVFNLLWLFLMFSLGLRFLQFTWHAKGLIQFLCSFRGKTSDSENGFCSKLDFDGLCDSKVLSCKDSPLDLLDNPEAKEEDNSSARTEVVNDGVLDDDDDDDDCERECSAEDEENDVMSLRRLVKIERLRADMAYSELEKERMACASAADEAMAMILRLQNEKSSAEIEAKQYRQLAEQKQNFHQEVIDSLQWDIIILESERSELEENLRLYIEKLKKYVMIDEVCGTSMKSLRSTKEDGIKDVPNISMDNLESSSVSS